MNAFADLSPRQREVLELMCRGLPTKLIAQELQLSVNTVAEYRSLILQHFKVANAVELVNKVSQLQSIERQASRGDVQAALDIPPHLVVVDDDATYRADVVEKLQEAGFPCRGVGSGAELGAVLADQPTQIVVLDLNLGEEDGLEIARKLRETGNCGIIMMTTRGMVEQRIDGLAMGADAYLVKPVDLRELTGVIRNLHRRQVEWRYREAV